MNGYRLDLREQILKVIGCGISDKRELPKLFNVKELFVDKLLCQNATTALVHRRVTKNLCRTLAANDL